MFISKFSALVAITTEAVFLVVVLVVVVVVMLATVAAVAVVFVLACKYCLFGQLIISLIIS